MASEEDRISQDEASRVSLLDQEHSQLNIFEIESVPDVQLRPQFNTRALAEHDPGYNLGRFDKNLLIIFNQINIMNHEPRVGTNEDKNELVETLKPYGFEDETYDDLTRREIFHVLDQFKSRDFTEYGCILVAIFTHGLAGGRLFASDTVYTERDLITSLKGHRNNTLVTKPVIVLIEASRGTEIMKGVPVIISPNSIDNLTMPQYYLPVEADLMVVHNCYPGKLSMRTIDGSWFIQAFCAKVRELADTTDFETIMTEVKREVAINRTDITPSRNSLDDIEFEFRKQMPTVTSTLCRMLFLTKKDSVKMLVPNDFARNISVLGNYTPQIHDNTNASDEIQSICPEESKDKQEDTSLLQTQLPKYNRRALSKNAPTYHLELFDKNLLIIFNQINIIGYTPRQGTNEDKNELIKTLQPYGFHCECHDDLTKSEIFDVLNELAKRDFTNYGCIMVAVLTHGSDNGRLFASDGQYSESDLFKCLKNHKNLTLVSKPVILLIQACRGFESINGISVPFPNLDSNTTDQQEQPYYHLPVEADILTVHSSYSGKSSFRIPNGSWFIQTVCDKIKQFSDVQDFESIMKEVQKEIAFNRYNRVRTSNKYSLPLQRNSEIEFEYQKQMPTMTSTLIRKLNLKRKNIVAKPMLEIKKKSTLLLFLIPIFWSLYFTARVYYASLKSDSA